MIQSLVKYVVGRLRVIGDTDGTVIGNDVDKLRTSIYGKTSGGVYLPLTIDTFGRLQISPSSGGTNEPIVRVISINAGAEDFYEYVVGVGQTLQLYSYYAGGRANGVASLIKHNAATTALVTNGGMESAGEITPWAAVTGTFTAPTPDYSTVQKFAGTGSQRWIYTASGTALQRKQTFASPVDITGWRYITAQFYNDLPAGGGFNRTIQIILGSGASTQTYTFTGSNSTVPFNTLGWYKFIAEIDNPTTVVGTTFDPTMVTDISIYMKDSANRAGTVYWDQVQFEDAITVLHRLYLTAGLSSPQVQINPAETLVAGEKIYIAVKNLGAARAEFSSVVKGVLL